MKTLIFIALFGLLAHLSPGQSSDIKWLEDESLGSELMLITRVVQDSPYLYTAVSPFNTITGKIKYQFIQINQKGTIEKKEHINTDAKGNDIFLLDLWPFKGEIYGYYTVEKEKTATLYRDRIDKATMKFAGEEVELLSGSKDPNDLYNPIWEKKVRMESTYFYGYNFYFIEFTKFDYHLILKRENYPGKEVPELKAIVLNSEMEILNKVEFKLPGTNTDTELFDIEVDEKGGLYVLSGNFAEKIPACSIAYFPPDNGPMEKTAIPTDVYIAKLDAEIIPGGLIITGFRSEDTKAKNLALFVMHFVEKSKSISMNKTLSEFDYDKDDKLYSLSNDKTYLIISQYFTDSEPATTASGRPYMSSRITLDANVHLFDLEHKKIWEKTIENYVVAPGGGIMYDGILPFVYNQEYYLIQNTHPENPALSAKGQKIKMTTYGKERFGTEIIKFNEDGKVKRDFIYLRDEKIVTIPTHSRYYGNGKFLMYGDKATIGNSFQFGILDMTER